jgi:hypothetical protein
MVQGSYIWLVNESYLSQTNPFSSNEVTPSLRIVFSAQAGRIQANNVGSISYLSYIVDKDYNPLVEDLQRVISN